MKITDLNSIVVVPWDFSALSHDALFRTCQMVESPTQIRVIHVSQIPSPYEVGIAWEAISEETIRAQLETAFRREISTDLRLTSPDFQVLFGDPGRMICQFAEEEKADLIVVPSHGRSGFTRLLLGSVAERIVRHAHCPVLVLRGPAPVEAPIPNPGSAQKSVTLFA